MTGYRNDYRVLTNPQICMFAADCDTGCGTVNTSHSDAAVNHCDAASWSWAVSSVPVCRRVVHTRKISSPKLDSQFLQRVLSLIWNGLSPLQKISEFLQALQRVSQLPPHHLELVLQHLDPLDGEELVSLGTVERLFQVYRWDEEKKKLRD